MNRAGDSWRALAEHLKPAKKKAMTLYRCNLLIILANYCNGQERTHLL
jgi:hypothetical protein